MSEEEFDDIQDADLITEQKLADDKKVSSSNLLKKYQLPIIIGVVVVVIILFFSLFGGSEKSSNKNQSNANTNIMVAPEIKEKPKKKKKIKYVQLFTQMDSLDTSMIVKELSLNKIHFQTEQSGTKFTVLVDQDELDRSRNILAMKQLPGEGSMKGYALLDNASTLGVTEYDKRIRFLRALSGELEIALGNFDIIESAKVQIVLPEQRLFSVTQPPVTSSIIIRILDGEKITDEIVFSVIQLVSNAVENLQAENISVIDTEGNLLSDGIFERLAQKRAGIFEEEPEKKDIEAAISREEAIGSPIIPNYEMIQEWFEIKWDFEQKLKDKVERQLLGIMPLGSFKVEFTSDIGPLENGNIVDIKRQTVSIVVDGLNDEVFVDQAFKQQVFQTVAGTIGYVRGRDSIQLSIAEFKLYTDEELSALKSKYAKTGFFSLLWMSLVGIAFFGLLYWLYTQFKLRLVKSKEDKQINLREDLADLSDIEKDQVDLKPMITEIKDYSENTPQILAKVIESWLNQDVKKEFETNDNESNSDELDDDVEDVDLDIQEDVSAEEELVEG